MKRLTLIVVASFLLSGSGYAQISAFPWTEGFENGTIPSGWTQDYVSGMDKWTVMDIPHNGENGAVFLSVLGTGITKLITPQLDLSGLTNPVVRFWHIEPDYMGQNSLKIYYKNSSSGAWNLLGEYSNSAVEHIEEFILLPNVSNDYYVAFEASGMIVMLDDITVMDFTNYTDVAVASIVTPVSGIRLTSTEQVNVLIKNNGTEPITGFSLSLKLDGNLIATEPYTDTIPHFSQAVYTFNATLDLSAEGYYMIEVIATMINDEDNSNDSKIEFVSNAICDPITSFPWVADFEYGISDCWENIDVDGDGLKWMPYIEPNTVMSYSMFSNPNNWLITPSFVLNSNDYSLFFEVATSFSTSEKYSVLVSTTGTNPNDFTSIHTETFSITGDSKSVELSLNAYKGQTIYIAFRHWGEGGMALELSNIRVEDAQVGMDSHTLTNDVRVYPNPSNGMVTVSVTENSTVRVLDVLGKVVDTYTVNSNSMLNFTQAAGFYFLQVESNGKISTHKLVIIKD